MALKFGYRLLPGRTVDQMHEKGYARGTYDMAEICPRQNARIIYVRDVLLLFF